MLPQEAFKLGFIARCVEEGLTPEQTQALAKRANDLLVKQAGIIDSVGSGIGSGIGSVLNGVSSLGLPLMGAALAAPPAIGAAAAYLKNKATDVDGVEVEEAKKRELIDTYNRMAEQMDRQKQLRDYKQKRKQTGRVFL